MALTTINSDGVKDDSIVNADIKSDAAIAGSKVTPDFGSQSISGGKISLYDNGSTSTTVLIATDDGSPYALQIRNDGVSNAASSGLHFWQSNSGLGNIRLHGATAYLPISISQRKVDTNTTQTALYIDANQKVGIGTIDPHCANHGVHIKTGDSGVTTGPANRNEIFIEGNDHAGITIATKNNKVGGIGFDDPDGEGRGRVQYSHTSDKMQIYTSGVPKFDFTSDLDIIDGNLKVASGHGIDFSAQTSSSATGVTTGDETLDHYEEGTWTPKVRGSSAAGTYNASASSGKYTRIGDEVTLHIYISYQLTSSSGYWELYDIPFTAASDQYSTGAFFAKYMDHSNINEVLYMGSSATKLYIYGSPDNGSWSRQAVNNTTAGTDQGIIGSITYKVPT